MSGRDIECVVFGRPLDCRVDPLVVDADDFQAATSGGRDCLCVRDADPFLAAGVVELPVRGTRLMGVREGRCSQLGLQGRSASFAVVSAAIIDSMDGRYRRKFIARAEFHSVQVGEQLVDEGFFVDGDVGSGHDLS
jgi:hypothetical protein